ncbi:hypothetical protein SOVF_209800 [Spinacia oleracea]|nr:hypothetical protein SOVF_209800 [Spinacia oleracea]
MRFHPGARTALAFITLRVDGDRIFLFFRNPCADMLLQESELDKDLLEKAKILLCFNEFDRETLQISSSCCNGYSEEGR